MTSETLGRLLRIAYIATFGAVCGMVGAIYGAERGGHCGAAAGYVQEVER